MTKIPEKLRLDDEFEGDIDKVQNLLDDAYLDLAPAVNRKPDMIIVDDAAPTANDFVQDLGDFWLNRDSTGGTPELYIMTVKNPSSATWVQIF